jgi:hypothetical protein
MGAVSVLAEIGLQATAMRLTEMPLGDEALRDKSPCFSFGRRAFPLMSATSIGDLVDAERPCL